MALMAPLGLGRRTTCARGTRKRRRVLSGFDAASRIASVRIGVLLYLSNGNIPGAGADPWTASGATSTPSTVATFLEALSHALFTASKRTPLIKTGTGSRHGCFSVLL